VLYEKIVNNLNSKKDQIAKELKNISRLNAISVPELVEENHEGKPGHNSIHIRALASSSADLLHKDAIVNKVVVHMESYEKFVEYVSETLLQGIRKMIFIGENTRHHRYLGHIVSEANVIARHLMEAKGMHNLIMGNICLPEKGSESKRVLFRTVAGAHFFTTQILFDSRQIIDV
jgi:hypothetical protein